MSIETAKHICREICAYKGEPPCFELDARAGEEYRPCEECEPVAAWHDAEVERLERLERDEALEKAAHHLERHPSFGDGKWAAGIVRALAAHEGERKG